MKRNTLGILLIALPIPLLMFVLALYAISTFIISQVVATGTDSAGLMMFGQFVNIILSLLGLVAVVGIPFGMPYGIYLLATKGKSK